jgi:hypothetical protein
VAQATHTRTTSRRSATPCSQALKRCGMGAGGCGLLNRGQMSYSAGGPPVAACRKASDPTAAAPRMLRFPVADGTRDSMLSFRVPVRPSIRPQSSVYHDPQTMLGTARRGTARLPSRPPICLSVLNVHCPSTPLSVRPSSLCTVRPPPFLSVSQLCHCPWSRPRRHGTRTELPGSW